jgi:sugar phosphate isomerase/epimerase
MTQIPVGIQLFSIRDDCARDLPASLKAVAEMGYTGVEFAGYHGRSAPELRKLLDDLGLKCCGTHTGLDTLLGDALAPTIEFNLTIGNKYLVVPWIAEERRNSRAALLQTVSIFNEIAEKLAPHGLLVGYHNHSEEFQLIEGKTGFDWFYSNTAPSIIMQLDTGNAIHGGADPLDYLRRYANAATTIHLKEYSASNPNAIIGDGDINWAPYFEICESSGRTDWYIVEQESYAFPPLECIRLCREALRKMGR